MTHELVKWLSSVDLFGTRTVWTPAGVTSVFVGPLLLGTPARRKAFVVEAFGVGDGGHQRVRQASGCRYMTSWDGNGVVSEEPHVAIFTEAASCRNWRAPFQRFNNFVLREQTFTGGISFLIAICAKARVELHRMCRASTGDPLNTSFTANPAACRDISRSWIHRQHCTLSTHERPLHGLCRVSRAAPSSPILYRCLCNNNIIIVTACGASSLLMRLTGKYLVSLYVNHYYIIKKVHLRHFYCLIWNLSFLHFSLIPFPECFSTWRNNLHTF